MLLDMQVELGYLLLKSEKSNYASPSHPYTLPSRSRSQPANQNLSKSMAVPTYGQTADNKARKHNIVYSAFGG